MTPSARRLVGALIQVGLVVVVIVLFGRYVRGKLSGLSGGSKAHVETVASISDSLGPGDLRIYSVDSSLDIVLKGNQLMSGLSPKTVAKVRSDLDTSNSGGSIGRFVKQTVASAIGTHVGYDLDSIRDVRFDAGRLRVDWTNGREQDLFGGSSVNGEKVSNKFSEAEARRLINAVHAKKGMPAK